MKCLVVGAGRMGTAIIHAMSKLGFDVDACDPNKDNLVSIVQFCGLAYDFNVIKNIYYDVVISAAPYFVNEEVAKLTTSKGIPYCDLGGDPATSERIRKLAVERGIPCFTDLGLAPGLVNIIAEHAVKEKEGQVESVIMRVGGLPANIPDNKLKYNLTWSEDGLINSYMGMCPALVNSVEVELPALTALDKFDCFGYNVESFRTKGGSSNSVKTLKRLGVLNCEYKTIRYDGHHQFADFLINECYLDFESIKGILKSICGWTNEDQVLIDIELGFKDGNNRVYQLCVKHDEDWTAMQKSTAFPAACVAALVAEGKMPNKPVFEYLDIPLNEFATKLDILDDRLYIAKEGRNGNY